MMQQSLLGRSSSLRSQKLLQTCLWMGHEEYSGAAWFVTSILWS